MCAVFACCSHALLFVIAADRDQPAACRRPTRLTGGWHGQNTLPVLLRARNTTNDTRYIWVRTQEIAQREQTIHTLKTTLEGQFGVHLFDSTVQFCPRVQWFWRSLDRFFLDWLTT